MKLPCIRSGHRILSPIVGYISHKTRSIAPGSEEIATIRRLGQIFSITIEGELGRYIADVANGTYLGVGVQIGHIERDETSNIDRFDSESVEDNSAIGDEHVFSILAPVSGFLIYTTADDMEKVTARRAVLQKGRYHRPGHVYCSRRIYEIARRNSLRRCERGHVLGL